MLYTRTSRVALKGTPLKDRVLMALHLPCDESRRIAARRGTIPRIAIIW